jgi:hypothetical protein
MEKKYISIPMKMAREVLLDAVSKNWCCDLMKRHFGKKVAAR